MEIEMKKLLKKKGALLIKLDAINEQISEYRRNCSHPKDAIIQRQYSENEDIVECSLCGWSRVH